MTTSNRRSSEIQAEHGINALSIAAQRPADKDNLAGHREGQLGGVYYGETAATTAEKEQKLFTLTVLQCSMIYGKPNVLTSESSSRLVTLWHGWKLCCLTHQFFGLLKCYHCCVLVICFVRCSKYVGQWVRWVSAPIIMFRILIKRTVFWVHHFATSIIQTH